MQTEKEYLEGYDIEKYPRPSVTTDIAAFRILNEYDESYRKDPKNTLSILLIKRGRHPFLDCWALPGGFLRQGETVEECAVREIAEETNVTPSAIVPVGVFSEVGRDPRGWVISNAFISVISGGLVNEVGGDDASDAKWFDVGFEKNSEGKIQLTFTNGDIRLESVLSEKESRFGGSSFEIEKADLIAFDHAKIIAASIELLRSRAEKFEMIFDFLPEKFTLTSLQKVQETITGIAVSTANFRRKVNDYVVETEEYTTGAGHRPAKLFRRKAEK